MRPSLPRHSLPEEVILDTPAMHPQNQSNSEGYTDQSDTHFSEQSDLQANTSGSAAPNSGDLDSPGIDNAESDHLDSENHTGAAPRPQKERR